MEAIFMFRTGETFDLDCLLGRRFNATSMYREHTFYLQFISAKQFILQYNLSLQKRQNIWSPS